MCGNGSYAKQNQTKKLLLNAKGIWVVLQFGPDLTSIITIMFKLTYDFKSLTHNPNEVRINAFRSFNKSINF